MTHFKAENAGRLTWLENRINDISREMVSLENIRSRITTAERITRQNDLASERNILLMELDRMTDNRIEMTEELLKLIHGPDGSFVFEEAFEETVESVTVHDRGFFTVKFRCGLVIEYDGR